MKRRIFLTASAVWLLAGRPVPASAQSRRGPVVIGWLAMGSREAGASSLAAFKQGLAELGWKEGAQVVVEARWAEGKQERLSALLKEVLAMKPAVIVVGPRAVTVAAKEAPNTPLVQAAGGDLVTGGFAKTYARPGGMVTGITGLPVDASEKYIELLASAVPKLRRIGFLIDPNVLAPDIHRKTARQAAKRLSLQPLLAEAATAEAIEPALASLAKQGAEALVPMPSPFFGYEQPRILRFAQAQRWPMAGGSGWAERGALLSYFADASENHRRSAHYVDRILKGTKPGDLPLEQPRKFELVINAKTARALGISVPQSVLLQASRVIE